MPPIRRKVLKTKKVNQTKPVHVDTQKVVRRKQSTTVGPLIKEPPVLHQYSVQRIRTKNGSGAKTYKSRADFLKDKENYPQKTFARPKKKK